MVFNSATEVNIPPALPPLQRYEIWGKFLQRACECCLLLSWVPYILATLWGNSEMWSIDHRFPLWAEGEISPPWAPKRVEIPSMPSLGCPFSPALCLKAGKYTQVGRGLLWDLTFPEMCTLKPAFPSYHNSIHLPPSSGKRYTAYWQVMRHQRPRTTAFHLPVLSPDAQVSHLSSTHMTFKLSD